MVKSNFVWMKLFNIIHREKYCILKQTVKISLKNNYDENFLPSATLLPYILVQIKYYSSCSIIGYIYRSKIYI